MGWDFETDPEYQQKLDWAAGFVREEVEPLDYLFPHQQFVPMTDAQRTIINPLKDEVRRQGLWATHLGPDLGGQGSVDEVGVAQRDFGAVGLGVDGVRHPGPRYW